MTARWSSSATPGDFHVIGYSDAARTKQIMNEEVVDRPNFHWVEIGATTQVYWRELPDVPYTDEDGTGTFHLDIVWDNHSTSLPIPAGMLAVDLIFEPEYPA